MIAKQIPLYRTSGARHMILIETFCTMEGCWRAGASRILIVCIKTESQTDNSTPIRRGLTRINNRTEETVREDKLSRGGDFGERNAIFAERDVLGVQENDGLVGRRRKCVDASDGV